MVKGGQGTGVTHFVCQNASIASRHDGQKNGEVLHQDPII